MPDQNLSNEEFDVTLAKALERVNAPEGFATKVMAEAGRAETKGPHAKVLMFPKAPMWLSGAIAAVLVMGVVVGERVHVEHQRQEVAMTQQKFDEGLRATNHALDQTREQLAKAGLNLGE